MASKKIKIEGSKEKGVQGEGKPELLRVEVGGLRAKSFQLSVGALEQALALLGELVPLGDVGGEPVDEQPLEHRVLADDHALDLVQRLLERVARLVWGHVDRSFSFLR